MACVLPVPSVSSSGPLTFCDGGSVTLTSSSGAGYTYKWKKDGGVISNATTSSYIALQSGTYVVEVTLDTCVKTSDPVVVTVNAKPTGTLTADQTICQGTSVTLTAGGGSTYNWSAPGANANTLIVSPTNTITYSVTITNSLGCNDVKSSVVTVKPLPLATISVAGSSTLCSGQSVNLNASGGAGYTYQWKLNTQPVSGATNQQYTANTQGDYQVVTTLNGCSKESAVTTITVNPLPTPTITPDATICATDSITLTATGGTSYQWNSGGPATASYRVAPTTTKTYTVSVTNSFNCTQTASTTITVKPLPNANVSISGGTTLCSGQSINLNASTGTGYSYQWYRDNNVLNGQTTATLNVTAAGSYKVVVTLDGCSKTSAVQNITVNSLPTPTITPDATTCAGDSITLTATGGTSYQWNSGGPATASYRVAPTSTKTYTVTVTNANNCTQTASTTITVKPLPNANVSVAGSTTLCAGQSVNLNASTGTGYSYQWYKDNNTLNAQTSATLSVNAAGSYKVVVTLDGCSKTSVVQNIVVNPVPTASVSANVTICAGDSTTLVGSGGTAYQWNSGGPATASYKVAPTSTKTYTVTVSNVHGCTASASVTVTVIPLPNASVSLSGPATFCADRTLTLTASSGTDYSYAWTKNSSTISGATNGTYVATETGIYEVRVTANGCSKKSTPVNVTVNPLPVPVASADTTICSADTARLVASGGTGYQWFNGSTSTTIQVSPTNTTTYGVTVSNSFGCSATESIIVSTIARPTATVTPIGSVSICTGLTATLTASSGTGYTYQWMEGASILNGQTGGTFNASTTGNYSVVVTANGCPKKSNTVAVTVNSIPVTSASNDTTICSGNPVNLIAYGGNSYKWSNGSTSQSITVSPATTTSYQVTVTSGQNCSATENVFVSVIPSPNANVTLSGTSTICIGDTVTLSASTGASYFYQWKKDGNDLTGETNVSYHATTPGAYTVLVTALGCPKTSSATNVLVNSLPTATVSSDSTTICQGESIELMAFGGTSFRWSNGRFTQANTVNPNVTSVYSVTVTDVNGCTATDQSTVLVLPLPNANITSSGNSNLCSGETVTLHVSSGTGYSYQWKKDGVSIGGATSSSYLAGETGAFTADVTLSGCRRTSNPLQVNVNPSLVAWASNDTTVCAGDTISLIASGGATFAWSSGETTDSILTAPTSSKTFSVTVSNGTTCTDVETIVVTVKPRPNAFINVAGSISSICDGQTATLNANTGAGLTYQWFKDSLAIADADSSRYLTGAAGSYTLEVTLNGCSKLSAAKDITVNPLPVVQLTNDTTVCSETPVTLNVSGGVSYLWNTFATDSVYQITTATTKTYTVTVTNSYGCKASDNVVVSTLPLPTNVTISTTSSTSICDGKTVRLNVGNTNGTQFQWQLDQTDIPGATSSSIDAGDEGDYTIVVTGNGCSKTSPKQRVTVKPTPETPEIIRIGEDSLKSSVAGGNYKWFRDGLTFSVGHQKVKVTKSGVYTVYVSENNCSSDTSAPYYFYFTGMNENDESAWMIYPNPNEGRFILAMPPVKEQSPITVYNAIGEQVWHMQATPGDHKLRIDLSHLPEGVYHLQAGGFTKKLVIAGK